MKRRDVLTHCGAVGIAGLAGCGAAPQGTTVDERGESPTATPTPTPGPPPTLTETSIDPGEASCGTGDDEASVAFDEAATTVEITGTVGASTPCHTATIDAVSYDADRDRLSVTVSVDGTGDDDMCSQCLADIPYTVTAVFEGRLPASVVVAHAGQSAPVAEATHGSA